MGGCPVPCPDPCVCPGRLAWQDGRHVLAEYLLSSRPGVGGLAGTASQTGLALQGLLAAMLVFSSPCIRRSGHFEVSPTAMRKTPGVPKLLCLCGRGSGVQWVGARLGAAPW